MRKIVKVIIYERSRIVIENYNTINEIDISRMVIDDIVIKGEDLKIKVMNQYMIELIGNIKGIEYEEISG